MNYELSIHEQSGDAYTKQFYTMELAIAIFETEVALNDVRMICNRLSTDPIPYATMIRLVDISGYKDVELRKEIS